MGIELSGKRLEIFRESFPKSRRLAVLWFKEGNVNFQEIRDAAQALGFHSLSLEIARPEDFDAGFALAGRERADGLFVATAAFLSAHRKRIIEFAAKNKLPATYSQETYVEDGGLMSYSPSIKDSFRQAAIFVDKILKGAKPADLPVERPRKLELWVNLKTAKQIGLTIPPNMLARADRVIR
jgi:putative ABC transport system substrate-binding protein